MRIFESQTARRMEGTNPIWYFHAKLELIFLWTDRRTDERKDNPKITTMHIIESRTDGRTEGINHTCQGIFMLNWD